MNTFVGGFILMAILFDIVSDIKESTWWYRLTYPEYKNITVNPRPTDCDFMTAPLGRKSCRYERHIVTMKSRWNTNHFEVSYDDGASWQNTGSSAAEGVIVSWLREERP